MATGQCALALSATLRAHDGDERHTPAGATAEVVREREPGISDLPLPRLPAQLQPGLVEHPQAARADRVAEGLQPAVDIDREAPRGVEGTVEDVAPRLAPIGEAEVLHEHDLRGGEAVVHLREGQRR